MISSFRRHQIRMWSSTNYVTVCSLEGYMSFQGYDISAAREIVPRLQNLLTTFRARGFPIYHTREGHRPDLSTLSSRELTRSKNNQSGLGIGDYGPLGRLLIRGQPGHDIIPELYPLPGENVIDKPGRSAFQHTEFGLMLKIKGIKNLLICGVTTDVCVHSTMREANDNGFDCLLVEDATSASEPHLHAGAVESVKAEGGIFGAVSTTDKILAALEVKKKVKANEPVGNGAAVIPSDIKFVDPLTLSSFSYDTPSSK
jgi:nicotinamidase-related amidase